MRNTIADMLFLTCQVLQVLTVFGLVWIGVYAAMLIE